MDLVYQLLSLTPNKHERLAFSGNKSQRKGHAGGRTNNTGDHRHWKIDINREHQKNRAREGKENKEIRDRTGGRRQKEKQRNQPNESTPLS